MEYKTDYFSITILDFSLKQDINYSCNLAELSQFALFSSYIFNASGEIFTPYQQLSRNKSLVFFNHHQSLQFHLHKHSNYHILNVHFTQKIIDDYLVGQYELSQELIFQIFQETKCFISDKISKIADEILNYKISSVGSELFYEVKAKEWLSIIINDYYSQQKEKKINPDDN